MQALPKLILTSKVYDILKPTPLEKANELSDELGFEVFLKREDLTPVHSFKIRGAYNKMANLSSEEQERGVICASAGNHAQGVAYSAKLLGIKAVIVMPETTPNIKINAVRKYGANIILSGDNYSDADNYAKGLQTELNLTYVHPFDDEYVMAGQGTIAKEILDQLPESTHVFVPVGGGGLLAGIISYIKSVNPKIKIVAVEPEDSTSLQSALFYDKPITLDHVGIFADGVAVKQIGTKTFQIIKDKIDAVITVDNDEISAAIKQFFLETRSIAEPAGSLGLAGLIKFNKLYPLQNKSKAVAIISGSNINFERLQFIAERTLIGSEQELLFQIKLSEKPGSLKKLLKEVIAGYNITKFSYRKENNKTAAIFIAIQIKNVEDGIRFKGRLDQFKYGFRDLSKNDLANTHLKHMAGGGNLSPIVTKNTQEIFLDCAFPEKPGALANFLNKMNQNWNISLFHYRGLGGDIGRVLLGIEVPINEISKLNDFIAELNLDNFAIKKLKNDFLA